MDIALGIILGVCLSAAVGFRIFVPMLILSIAANAGYVELSDSFLWISTLPALIAFTSATIIEIIGYYVPWMDNMLDTISTPLSIVAGAAATGAVIIDVDPLISWTIAIILGGGSAFTVEVLTVKARALSSFFTGGLGNQIVATGELFFSTFISILAIVVPIVALAFLLFLAFVIQKLITRESNSQNKKFEDI
ncbi:MAG: DUF4126 domain-containing protein [Ignavibacteriae bacterium]|nr:DUF4126 domain-containing protein [Ignavibacteriota bacterium]